MQREILKNNKIKVKTVKKNEEKKKKIRKETT